MVNSAFLLFNMMVAFILIVYLTVTITYWINMHNARRFSLISTKLFDKDGQEYNISIIVDQKLTPLMKIATTSILRSTSVPISSIAMVLFLLPLQ